jgi:PAS domain S-box-containing protein
VRGVARKLKILLIEDNPGDARLIEHLLRVEGGFTFDLDLQESLTQGLDSLQRTPDFDIILLDLALPDSWGIDTFLRVHEVAPHIPIIILTSFDDEELAIKSVKNGAQDYLVKCLYDGNLMGRSILYAIERHKADVKLRQNQMEVKSLLSTMQDYAFIMNSDGIILHVNEAVRKLGYEPEELVGKSKYDIIPPDKKNEARTMLRELSKGNETTNTIPLMAKGGSEVSVENKCSPGLWGDMNVVFCISRDTTETKRSKDALREANRKLNLLSNVTRHDILNQICIILGYIDLMTEYEQCDPVVKQYTESIKDATGSIQRQIAFTEVYQDLGVKDPEWQRIEDVVGHAILNLSLDGISVEVNTGNLVIYADPLLEKVFFNLMENSLRHGEGVTSITISHYLDKDHRCIILFEDNGIGISENMKEKVFERGMGMHTGYGLFLVREILGITDIMIIESGQEGKGARFEIVVPEKGFRNA